MTNTGDSPLSITGSIVGIVALVLSVSTIIQAVYIYASAYRAAPAELKRYTSSVSNTMDERSYRLRSGHIPGPINLALGGNAKYDNARWTEMLEEYYEAHLELEDELHKIKHRGRNIDSLINWNRILWLFRKKDLDESVQRVETLRSRKMAVCLNALLADVSSMKETLNRIEARIPQGPLRLPVARPPEEPEHDSLARPLNLYASSVLGESVTDIVRTSLDSR
ncbi:hypothetical protein EJ05DRAFT_497057 [Pseudovirgaria hyperparasitica]|uniref:Uncharacterized protein n=1 Tax=Pseudovirgaria hyperparasitica TaxID=470096 RepID=A0A6A6WJ22_9PEZI|nr:uncharacterized protein EJ05DRAFT_497057 [Pseudovirgaria hyperparasitica]KAF2762194.1 hypothetical protein EJ05DRAFT_497057 [Pseudovirgaria hyperparasitica]